ncbi:hypothetical protein [uncultured Nostoc sp.]|uniref:hypothetical protein n=1 Tax=uncultured Nostoc sp. TaxID=340711 RepID=UPI0035C9BCFE
MRLEGENINTKSFEAIALRRRTPLRSLSVRSHNTKPYWDLTGMQTQAIAGLGSRERGAGGGILGGRCLRRASLRDATRTPTRTRI